MILFVDNRDSFVFNLVRYVEELGAPVRVADSRALSLDEVAAWRPCGIILSPGPGTPVDAGVCVPLVRRFAGAIPILGVCLGHQCIAAAFGWRIARARSPRYGQSSPVRHTGAGLFQGLPNPLQCGLYHSLIAEPQGDAPLRSDAWSPSGEVMALSHGSAPVHGVQFHPESSLSEAGHDLLANFLRTTRVKDMA